MYKIHRDRFFFSQTFNKKTNNIDPTAINKVNGSLFEKLETYKHI